MTVKKIVTTILCFILILFTETSVLAETQSESQQMRPKWYQLNKLINKELRLIKKVKKKGASLNYRKIELYSEKLALIKEKENKLFLQSGSAKTKKRFFKRSRRLERQVLKLGKYVIKRYPYYSKIGNIYYTLALNSRDFGTKIWTAPYLLMALKKLSKKSKANIKLRYNAKMALAEHYYNSKKYKKAIRYYHDILTNPGDEWHLKHLYNAAWCYLKVLNHSKALRLLLLANSKSKDSRYISVKSQILDNAGTFFTYASKPRAGAKFYIKNSKDPSLHILKMAKTTASNGDFKNANYLLNLALKQAQSTNNIATELEIYQSKINIYRQFTRADLFYKTILQIITFNETHKEAINKETLIDISSKISELVGLMQLQLSKDFSKNRHTYSKRKLKQISNFFDALSRLDKNNARKYMYYKGESYFSIHQYNMAAHSYAKALKYTIASEDLELKKKILDSFLGTFSKTTLKRKKSQTYLELGFTEYIKHWPNDKKSKEYYKRLFNLYVKQRKLEKANTLLMAFNNDFPDANEMQKTMMTLILDYYIATKNIQKLSILVKQIEQGLLDFDEVYIKKAHLILATLLFERYQGIAKSGDKQKAIEGYLSLYNNKTFSKKIRSQAAYSTSILYLDLLDTEKSYKWISLSMQLMSRKALIKSKSELNTLASRYFFLQDFTSARKLSKTTFRRLCNMRYKNKSTSYEKSIHFALIDNKADLALKIYGHSKKCKIPREIVQKVGINIINHFFDTRDNNNYFSFFRANIESKDLYETFNSTIIKLYWHAKDTGDAILAEQIDAHVIDLELNGYKDRSLMSFFKQVKKLNELSVIADSFEKDNLKTSEVFNENQFNNDLAEKISVLKGLTNESMALINKQYEQTPELTVATYQLLSDSYEAFAEDIRNVDIKGETKTFIASFKKEMGPLANNIAGQGSKYHKIAKEIILKNNLFTVFNHKMLEKNKIREVLGADFFATDLNIPMDTTKAPK
ncbi:MAG: hypothetical protein ISR65_02750 [Bacteriovoracaceae bacterium]|nr:hypothetical protein [Bacteriovoracaceae bacterium]